MENVPGERACVASYLVCESVGDGMWFLAFTLILQSSCPEIYICTGMRLASLACIIFDIFVLEIRISRLFLFY